MGHGNVFIAESAGLVVLNKQTNKCTEPLVTDYTFYKVTYLAMSCFFGVSANAVCGRQDGG